MESAQMVREIDQQLKALRAEQGRLERARHALVNGHAPGRVPAPGGKSGRRVKRADQAVELIGKHPGITIPELAHRMGIPPNYLYRVVPALAEQGKVHRTGEGWHPGKAKPAKPAAKLPHGRGTKPANG